MYVRLYGTEVFNYYENANRDMYSVLATVSTTEKTPRVSYGANEYPISFNTMLPYEQIQRYVTINGQR